VTKAIQNTVNVNPGGDKVNEGIAKIIAEVELIYGHLNSLFGLQAGASQPADRNVNDLWLDTSGTPTLKRWDGAAWVAQGASGNFASGVSLDNSSKGVSVSVLLGRASATSLQIPGSSAAPAMLGVGGHLLQNTTNTSCSFSGAAAGTYAIYAERSGTTSNFTLARAIASGFAPSASQRIVGYAKYTGSDFTWIRSSQVRDPLLTHVPEGYFHMYRTAGQALGAEAPLLFNGISYDFDGGCDTGTARFTAVREGFHDIFAAGECYLGAAAGSEAQLYLKINGVTVQRGSSSCGTPGTFTHTPKAFCSPWLNVGDYVTVTMFTSPAMVSTLSGSFACALWGRWVGKKY
jgi:hypothetical protein